MCNCAYSRLWASAAARRRLHVPAVTVAPLRRRRNCTRWNCTAARVVSASRSAAARSSPECRSACLTSPVEVLPTGTAACRWDLMTIIAIYEHLSQLLTYIQWRCYVGVGDTCPQIHLLPPVQKLGDRSNLISEVPKCSQNPNFPELRPGPRWGAYIATPDHLADGEGARCPLPRTPSPLLALRASFLRVSGCNLLQS